MMIGDVRPTTVEGVKRLATQFRKQRGIKQAAALDLAAQAAQCSNYSHARRVLPHNATAFAAPYVYLTVYWLDQNDYSSGRETLRVPLAKPARETCSRSEFKQLRGFGSMRLVASDHFVCDELSASQENARDRICKAVRALRFVEHTGLRPSREFRRAYPGGTSDTKLPDSDHATDWVDPATDQFVVIDEPYRRAPDEADRAEWAVRHGWQVIKSSWPGMYNPHNCDLYVASASRDGFDIEALVAKINAMPLPLLVSDWAGESAQSFDTFVSPMATTPQDKRRAKSRGTVFPVRTETTVPYRMMFGRPERRPAGAPGVEVHQSMGRMIKAVLRSSERPYGAYRRMDSVRSTLEDWMALEIGRGELDGPEFFDVYYHEEDEDVEYAIASRSPAGLIQVLQNLRTVLMEAYPNCAPLRRVLHKIDVSATLIERMNIGTA